jgi:DNA-binding NarL/FixJ family response regulator
MEGGLRHRVVVCAVNQVTEAESSWFAGQDTPSRAAPTVQWSPSEEGQVGASEAPASVRSQLSEYPLEGPKAAAILIVEDHEMLAEALVRALSDRGYECTVAQLTSTASVLEQAAQVRPALVLLDLNLDDADGLDLIPGLRATGAKVLVVTACTDQSRVASALVLGASGSVSKAQPFERLLDAAESVLRNRPLLSDARHGELIQLGTARLKAEREVKQRMAQLTARERQVLWALSRGEGADEIARAFFLSIGTVRSHIQAILGKLEVSSQLAAVAQARLLLVAEDAPKRLSQGGQR